MNTVDIVTRRTFLGGVFSAGALVLTSRVVPGEALIGTSTPQAAATLWQPSVYLGIEPDGRVIIVAHRSEMGTGIRSVLPAVLADELEADMAKVTIDQALGDTKYGSQNTDGSCSIRDFYDAMRQAGASARLMLERSAAAKWGVDASECKARNHEVIHAASNRKAGFGELVAGASQIPVPKKDELRLKTPAEFRYVGKDLPIVDLKDLCTGKGKFGIDASMKGMVFASIERSPVLGGKMKSYDDQEAKKVKGVQQTVVIEAFKPPHQFKPLGGVAVIADNTWSAWKGREKLKVEWEPGENASFESEAYKKALQETVRSPQRAARNVGDVDAEFAKGGKVIEAEYYVPMLSHAPMEPPAAVADFRDGKCVIMAATQNPQAVNDTVAAALGIDKKNVECHVTLLGGGIWTQIKA